MMLTTSWQPVKDGVVHTRILSKHVLTHNPNRLSRLSFLGRLGGWGGPVTAASHPEGFASTITVYDHLHISVQGSVQVLIAPRGGVNVTLRDKKPIDAF